MWLKSCEANETIDFILFTDAIYNKILPKNVKIINFSLNNIKELLEKNLKIPVWLESPYKLCDYKPMYGLIFKEYLKGYDFWAYCDMDLLFGDIREFLTDEMLEKYERLYVLGHFSVYQNNDKMRKIFMTQMNSWSYKDVCKDGKIYVFDEVAGMYKICLKNNVKQYTGIDYIDVNNKEIFFKITDDVDDFFINKPPIYKYQTFCWNNKKLYHIYIDENKEIKKREILYIHYSKRDFMSIDSNNFLITYRGFKDIIEKLKTEDIIEANYYKETIKDKLNKIIKKVKQKINNQKKYSKLLLKK